MKKVKNSSEIIKTSFAVIVSSAAVILASSHQPISYTAKAAIEPAPTYSIFKDSLTPGWENWSWGGKATITDYITFVSTANNGGLYLRSKNPIILQNYVTLRFSLNASNSENLIKIYFYGSDKSTPLNTKGEYILPYRVSGTQYNYTIPLSMMHLPSNASINGFSLQFYGANSSGKELRIDDIYLK